MPTKSDIENAIRTLLARYNAEYVLLFGSRRNSRLGC